MASLNWAGVKRASTMSLACAALVLCGQAAAQTKAPAAAGGATKLGDPGTAFEGSRVERDDAKHLTIWHSDASGPVQVTQNGARLVCDTLYIYSYAAGEGPNATTPGKPAPAGDANDPSGGVKQMVAEGHVYYVTQSENVRGDHMVYDKEPDIITMTGDVVAVQGKNVARGDKMVIDRKTGQTNMASDATGRNKPNRVRAVIYNDNQGNQGQAPSAPAKKP